MDNYGDQCWGIFHIGSLRIEKIPEFSSPTAGRDGILRFLYHFEHIFCGCLDHASERATRKSRSTDPDDECFEHWCSRRGLRALQTLMPYAHQTDHSTSPPIGESQETLHAMFRPHGQESGPGCVCMRIIQSVRACLGVSLFGCGFALVRRKISLARQQSVPYRGPLPTGAAANWRPVPRPGDGPRPDHCAPGLHAGPAPVAQGRLCGAAWRIAA